MKTDDELAAEMDSSIQKTLQLKDLNIYYDATSDTLSLWNGLPAGFGEMVAKNLIAESNAEGEVVGITLEHAAELLRPYLFQIQQANQKKAPSDTEVKRNDTFPAS